MPSYAVVFGKAVGREMAGPRSEFLLVEDKSEPEYPKLVACEFYGDKSKAMLEAIKPGDMVQVEGVVRSNRSVKGRLFTSFSAFRALPINDWFPPGGKAEQWPEKHEPAPPPREPGDDDDKETQGGWF